MYAVSRAPWLSVLRSDGLGLLNIVKMGERPRRSLTLMRVGTGCMPACYTFLWDFLIFLELSHPIECCRARACAWQVTGFTRTDIQAWRYLLIEKKTVRWSRSACPGMRLRARACLIILELEKPRVTRDGKRHASQAVCAFRADTRSCSAFAAPLREQLT